MGTRPSRSNRFLRDLMFLLYSPGRSAMRAFGRRCAGLLRTIGGAVAWRSQGSAPTGNASTAPGGHGASRGPSLPATLSTRWNLLVWRASAPVPQSNAATSSTPGAGAWSSRPNRRLALTAVSVLAIVMLMSWNARASLPPHWEVPEIDPSAMGSAVMLLVGGFLTLTARRKSEVSAASEVNQESGAEESSSSRIS